MRHFQRFDRDEVSKSGKGLKIGFGLEDVPSGDYYTNSLFFAIGVLVYNTAVIMKEHLLPTQFKNKTIETLRWSIINLA